MLTGGLVIIYQCFNALTKDIEYLNGNMRRPRNSISNRGRRVEGVGIVLPKIACGNSKLGVLGDLSHRRRDIS